MSSKSTLSTRQKQVLNQPSLYFQTPERQRRQSLRRGGMENEDEQKGDSTHPRGCISFEQIIYSAGGLGGVMWRTWGGVGLALGVE